MSRPSWWAWHEAARTSSLSTGAYATAMVWAGLCWNWRAGDRPDSHRAQPLYLIELADAHPGGIGEQTVRRRLKELTAAGLLERVRGHSRHGSNVYAPTLPNTGQDVPVFSGNTGQDVPVSEPNTGQSVPVFSGNTGQDVPVSEPNTGQSVPQHRSIEVPPPFSPEGPETPRAPTHTRIREAAASSGGITDDGRTAMYWLLRSMDAKWGPGTSSGLAAGYQQQATARLSELRAAGWGENDLVNRLNAREWSTAGSVGRTLMARLRDFDGLEPPLSPAEQSRQRMAEQRSRQVVTCPHGTPGGRRNCALCRAQVPADDDAPEALTAEEALALARSSLRGQ